MKKQFLRAAMFPALLGAALLMLLGFFAGLPFNAATLAFVLLLISALTGRLLWAHLTDALREHPFGFTELAPLRAELDERERRLQDSARAVEEREHDLDTLRDNMQEGLIIVDRKGYIRSVNHAAVSMLMAESKDYTGQYIMRLCSHPSFVSAVLTATGGNPRRAMLDIDGTAVSVYADPVRVSAEMRGAVILLFDVTERAAAEQLRREFTANVSHELKTPLTAVSGYAELLSAGMVPAEDVKSVGENIRCESSRLIALIDDILNLARLDEGGYMERETVDLGALAAEVAERLQSEAGRCGVTLTAGGHGTVTGNRRMLEEMISNLAVNAIKYNRPNGTAAIEVRCSGRVELSVTDTGIGIPRAHQDHIFERFYRVDKSRSKSTGGTGLGLSIVKHAAELHNADIRLDSTPEIGTCVTVIFPPEAYSRL